MHKYSIRIYKDFGSGYEQTNALYTEKESDEEAFRFFGSSTAGGMNIPEDKWYRGDSPDGIVCYWNVDAGGRHDQNNYLVCLERAE